MRIKHGRFKITDTANQISRGLAQRPVDYILFKTTIPFGGNFQGVRGGHAFNLQRMRGAVAISIFQ